MQRYSALIVALALFWGGCALKPTIPKERSELNALLIEATFLESQGYYETAAKLFEKAYLLESSKALLQKVVTDYFKARAYDKALALVQKALKEDPKDVSLLQLEASIYLAKKDYEKAKEAIQKALAIRKSAKNYEYLASIYLAQKRYDIALKYYKSAYAIDPSAHNVNTIAYIMYFYLGKRTEAIAYLETHTRMYGCTKDVCKTLISLYGFQNNVEGLISVYKRLYETYKSFEYLKKLIELYIYQKDYKEALHWAKKLGDKKYILDLYKLTKEYREAYRYAQQLYEETGDLKYLAQAAIFEYESAKKKDRALLMDVAKKLEKVVAKLKDPVYLNYLGYLYIDHDIDVHRGIRLVEEALKFEPDSPYYLDSLAWGYYKIGACKKALKIIKRVYFDLDLKDSEVESHLKSIEACVKERE